jgi:hypothetical protein
MDASFISEQLTFPGAFSSPSTPPCFHRFGRGCAIAADVQIEAIPDSTGKYAIPLPRFDLFLIEIAAWGRNFKSATSVK